MPQRGSRSAGAAGVVAGAADASKAAQTRPVPNPPTVDVNRHPGITDPAGRKPPALDDATGVAAT